MVIAEKITHKFIQLDEFLEILKGMQRIPLDRFLKDNILVGAGKYYLQVSIECCLDIANHIIASEHLQAPADYADSFKVLEEHGIVTAHEGMNGSSACSHHLPTPIFLSISPSTVSREPFCRFSSVIGVREQFIFLWGYLYPCQCRLNFAADSLTISLSEKPALKVLERKRQKEPFIWNIFRGS